MNVRKTKLSHNTIDPSLTDSSKKPRPTMTDKHLQHCVPDDNEDLMILAECALHSVNTPSPFMAVPSSPSSLSSPNSYPPSSPMGYPSSPSPAEFYDSHQVEFTKDFIITVCPSLIRPTSLCLMFHVFTTFVFVVLVVLCFVLFSLIVYTKLMLSSSYNPVLRNAYKNNSQWKKHAQLFIINLQLIHASQK